jgi:hypothetical protein
LNADEQIHISCPVKLLEDDPDAIFETAVNCHSNKKVSERGRSALHGKKQTQWRELYDLLNMVTGKMQ